MQAFGITCANTPSAYYKTIIAQVINSSWGTQMSGEFRGLIYAPSYEDEVIMLFGMILGNLDDRFEIEEYNDEFPDCNAKINGKLVGIEFELYASNFKAQKHHLDPRLPNCDYLICWKNDTGNNILKLENKETKQPHEIKIIDLSKEIEMLDEKGLKFILNPEKHKHPVSKWEKETFLSQLGKNVENGKIKDDEFRLIEEFLNFCGKNNGLELVYGVGKIASLTVRVKKWGKIAPSGAMANGHIWINFKDANKSWIYPSPEIDQEVRRRFNQSSTGYYKYLRKDEETLAKLEGTLSYLVEKSNSLPY